tara:strand:- start:3799 stop:4059 length:261 start_codon:yes stop_codon:yes gene_type:complete
MNEFILCVLDRANRTVEELEENSIDADAAAKECADVAYAAYITACAAYVAYVAIENNSAAAEYWLNKYFEATGENRCDYEKAIKEK